LGARSFDPRPRDSAASFAHGSSNTRYARICTTAVRRGDKYVLNGSKVSITNGGHADWYTVFAKTDRDAGHRGLSAFVVPRDDTVIVDKHEDKMGLRASNTAALTFNETEVPRVCSRQLLDGKDGAVPGVEHALRGALTGIDTVYAIENVSACNQDVASPVEVQDFWEKHDALPGFAAGA